MSYTTIENMAQLDHPSTGQLKMIRSSLSDQARGINVLFNVVDQLPS